MTIRPPRFVLCFVVAATLTACGGGGGGGSTPPPPANRAPTASIASDLQQGLAPVTINFDGSGSADSDGSIASYAWNFGDGDSAAGSAASHTYAAGEFVVTLTVTDDDGASASTTVTVRGLAEPVAIAAAAADAGYAPFTVAFDGTGSTDGDDNIATYDWTFGDGSAGQGATIEHTYADLGQYTAALTVTDGDGYTSTTSLVVTVYAQLAGYYRGTLSSDVNMDAMDVEVIIGANNELHAWDYVDYNAGYWGPLGITGRAVSGTVSAQMWNVTMTFADGSDFGPITLAGDVVEQQSLVADYTGVGDTGTLDVQYVPAVSNQAYTLADIAGSWSYDDGNGFSDTVTIDANGNLDYAASDNCTATGTIAIIDPALNGFSASYDLQCPPGANAVPNGVRTGVGFVDDINYPDSWLVIAGSIGDEGTLLTWSRPMTAASGGGFEKAAMPATKPRVRGPHR